jgi:hypothetical protein
MRTGRARDKRPEKDGEKRLGNLYVLNRKPFLAASSTTLSLRKMEGATDCREARKEPSSEWS